MEEAGFPVPPSNDDKGPMLYFEFKDDLNGPVTTGHLNGCITIYLKEADSVFREVNRVEFGEAQRTLIGHFRHELGHYFWDRVVAPGPISQFRSVFGDETNPTYATAQAKYYSDGPLPRWQLSFVSAYASMHPWEDFAETFGLYQDIHAVLTTNSHFNASDADLTDLDAMVKGYRELGIFVNELNRDMGLQDLVPEVFNDTITGKLRFIHSLRSI